MRRTMPKRLTGKHLIVAGLLMLAAPVAGYGLGASVEGGFDRSGRQDVELGRAEAPSVTSPTTSTTVTTAAPQVPQEAASPAPQRSAAPASNARTQAAVPSQSEAVSAPSPVIEPSPTTSTTIECGTHRLDASGNCIGVPDDAIDPPDDPNDPSWCTEQGGTITGDPTTDNWGCIS